MKDVSRRCTGSQQVLGRRQWLGTFGMGLGGIALADLLGRDAAAASSVSAGSEIANRVRPWLRPQMSDPP